MCVEGGGGGSLTDLYIHKVNFGVSDDLDGALDGGVVLEREGLRPQALKTFII